MEALLSAGAAANAASPKGWTALMEAVFYGRTEAVRTLLAHGARVDAVDGNGATATHHAPPKGSWKRCGYSWSKAPT
jgi:ankyrin repeat protein